MFIPARARKSLFTTTYTMLRFLLNVMTLSVLFHVALSGVHGRSGHRGPGIPKGTFYSETFNLIIISINLKQLIIFHMEPMGAFSFLKEGGPSLRKEDLP